MVTTPKIGPWINKLSMRKEANLPPGWPIFSNFLESTQQKTHGLGSHPKSGSLPPTHEFFQNNAFSILTSCNVKDICTSSYAKEVRGMAVINIRDFPDTLHREAKAKAALEGITLKDLIIKAVEAYLKAGKKGGK
jgi:hypothetical protein